MTLNGNSRMTIMTAVLTAVVVIFIMLFTGLTGSVRDVQTVNRGQSERIVETETKLEGLVDIVNMIYIDQKEVKEDIKEILKVLR